MPAAAVIPERQALFGIVGCKGYVGGIHGASNKTSLEKGEYASYIKILELI